MFFIKYKISDLLVPYIYPGMFYHARYACVRESGGTHAAIGQGLQSELALQFVVGIGGGVTLAKSQKHIFKPLQFLSIHICVEHI